MQLYYDVRVQKHNTITRTKKVWWTCE